MKMIGFIAGIGDLLHILIFLRENIISKQKDQITMEYGMKKAASINVKVYPPPWQTWWAYLIYIFLF